MRGLPFGGWCHLDSAIRRRLQGKTTEMLQQTFRGDVSIDSGASEVGKKSNV